MTTRTAKTDNDTVEFVTYQSAEWTRIEAEARLMQAEALLDTFAAIGSVFKKAFRAVATPIAAWRERQRGYIELSEMNNLELADIGLTEGDVPTAANRDFQSQKVA